MHRTMQHMEDNAWPNDGTESLDDDVLEAPLEVQLAEVSELSKIQLANPLGQHVCGTH